jgi:hypothetical protein
MVTGPGPGVFGPGAMGALGMMQGPPVARATQMRFLGPEGMAVGWQIDGGFADNQLVAPASYNFMQGATYRLKLSSIPGRELPPIYPSLHVYPVQPQTEAYLAHNAIPIRIENEDLDQVASSNFVTKVIYLPDARFQELAVAGVEELVSTRLPLGQDPIQEADRRGTIMAVLRMGNMDVEMPSGAPTLTGAPGSAVQQTSHVVQMDGEAGQYVAPMPIGDFTAMGGGVPGDVLVGGPAGPGQAPYNPIAGTGGVPMWGYPHVGTPIGLPGPPHIPLGTPASLKSHTMRNLTDVDLGEPVDHMLIDVRHEPGLSVPHPVKHVQYTEQHPVYSPGEVSMPAGGY